MLSRDDGTCEFLVSPLTLAEERDNRDDAMRVIVNVGELVSAAHVWRARSAAWADVTRPLLTRRRALNNNAPTPHHTRCDQYYTLTIDL